MDNEKRVTLASVGEIEYEEKKSIFIGYAAPVRTEEEARPSLKRRSVSTAMLPTTYGRTISTTAREPVIPMTESLRAPQECLC